MNGGPQPRGSSPAPGLSTLITRAPRSPSIIAACGPARARVRSTTRTPSSGPDMRGAPSDGRKLPTVSALRRPRRTEVLPAAGRGDDGGHAPVVLLGRQLVDQL